MPKENLQSNDWKQKELNELKNHKLLKSSSRECTIHQTPEYLHHAEKADYPPPRTGPVRKKNVNNTNIWHFLPVQISS